ncbi:MAG: ABC transporter ATP-binding protein [Pseudomonadota bacterium]
MNSETVLTLDQVRFGYDPSKPIIDIDHLAIHRGESIFLRGPSGSGKSTLLGLIGGVLSPQSGDIHLGDQSMTTLSPGRRDALRVDHLGIIFQQLNLLPYLSILANVTLPCEFSKRRRNQLTTDVKDEAKRLVESLGLPASDLHRPVHDLSVGQQQRVAVARALIGGPDLIIADEPTSALDHDNRDRFIELLNQQRKQFGSSLLFVSHDTTLAKHFDRSLNLSELNESVLNEGVMA